LSYVWEIQGRYKRRSREIIKSLEDTGRLVMGDGYWEVRGTEGGLVEVQRSRRDTKILARKIGTSGKNTTKCGIGDPWKIKGDQQKTREEPT
jgi:hypothetical protein